MANSNKNVLSLQAWRRGEPFVWATAGALLLVLLLTFVLFAVVIFNGLRTFWPNHLVYAELEDGTQILGEIHGREVDPFTDEARIQFKTGNLDMSPADFRWAPVSSIDSRSQPPDAVTLERMEDGNFYGFLESVNAPLHAGGEEGTMWERMLAARKSVFAEREKLKGLEQRISALTRELEQTRLDQQERAYEETGRRSIEEPTPEQQRLKSELDELVRARESALDDLRENTATFATASGETQAIALLDIVRAYRPNTMSVSAKLAHYGSKVVELLTEQPRESNTEGGLFPAIFGTVMLVFLMSVLSFPLGVVAGIYLREYAREGLLLRITRIAVNNLAGVPSIVYGIFGLGFFIYGIGGAIDQLFFPARLPTPTFGTGGMLWASLTLGLLTAPVVIVSTEEALGAIPRSMREASLSLGATKFQTLVRVLVPMASPGIMTGFILAMARAAGEVAPLMITGVVKLAPTLPIDGQFPYLHLDRKFMHLGFHIYDIGFQSPNVEAAKPMVYVTTLLLVLIVLVMSSVAIYLRNRMKRRYTVSGI